MTLPVRGARGSRQSCSLTHFKKALRCDALSDFDAEFHDSWAVRFFICEGHFDISTEVFCHHCHFASSFRRVERRISDRDSTDISNQTQAQNPHL